MAKLAELRHIFGDKVIAIAQIREDAIILPKKVYIKEDLTVWRDDRKSCIINGMKNQDFVYDTDLDKLTKTFESVLRGLKKYTYVSGEIIYEPKYTKQEIKQIMSGGIKKRL